MWKIQESKACEISNRLAWFKMHLSYAFKAMFGPRMRYQVVIRISSEASDDAPILALDALKRAYQETRT